jgi:hypothetical protein
MEGTRRVGVPPIRCLDSAEQDLRTPQNRNWKKKVLEGDQWRGIIEAGKACNML